MHFSGELVTFDLQATLHLTDHQTILVFEIVNLQSKLSQFDFSHIIFCRVQILTNHKFCKENLPHTSTQHKTQIYNYCVSHKIITKTTLYTCFRKYK